MVDCGRLKEFNCLRKSTHEKFTGNAVFSELWLPSFHIYH